MKKLIAIDPGKLGAIAVYIDGTVEAYPMPPTPTDIFSLLEEMSKNSVCYLERVHGMPKQKGMFTFGQGYGWLEMALLALEIPTVSVTPQKWQRSLELGVKSNMTDTQRKNKLKARAQQLYPHLKITLATADALLILNYAITNEK